MKIAVLVASSNRCTVDEPESELATEPKPGCEFAHGRINTPFQENKHEYYYYTLIK
jgi:hypothetical protein